MSKDANQTAIRLRAGEPVTEAIIDWTPPTQHDIDYTAHLILELGMPTDGRVSPMESETKTAVAEASKWIDFARHHLQADGALDRSMMCRYLNEAMHYLEAITNDRH